MQRSPAPGPDVTTPPLRVAFNATALRGPITGIGNYIIELAKALVSHRLADVYTFRPYRWTSGPPEAGPSGEPSESRSMFDRVKPLMPFRGSLRSSARYLGFGQGLRRHGIDLYHEQNYVPLSYDVPVVVTIHDLSWLHYPSAHPADRVRWLERGVPTAIERASRILVDSEFVRDEVLATFGIDCERVHVAHLGVAADFHPRTAEETAASLGALGLTHGGYVLSVGTIEPRKNLKRMVDAYSQLPGSLRRRFPLVIAGAPGWHSAGLVDGLRRAAGEQVLFAGHVRGSVLRDLYAGAAVFVFPSLYEGFGLPPLEAMASGVPVIVSNRTSLPEVVGDAGVMIDPEDSSQIARELMALLEDPDRQRELAARSVARASRFCWRDCALSTADAYQAALRA